MDRFIGTWRLLSFERVAEDGRVSHPFGSRPRGYLIYTDKGYMSSTIMAPERPHARFAGNGSPRKRPARYSWRRLRGSLEYLAASARYISYCGRFEVAGDKVIHHVDVSLLPDWIGTDQVRTFEFNGDRLLLSALIDGTSHRLLWKKATRENVSDVDSSGA